MKNENGEIANETDKIKWALDHLSEALCFLYETESDVGNALAFMVDSAVKYGQVVMRGHDVLFASSDYSAYEQKVFEEFKSSKGDK